MKTIKTSSLRFLLVHPDPQQSERIACILADANHTVLPTTGLEEASDALAVERFDAVLLEPNFGSTGLAEFSAKLRQLAHDQHLGTRVPILALTSEKSAAPRASGEDQAFDAYLSDPIDPALLSEAVDRLAHAVGQQPVAAVDKSTDELPTLEPEKFEEQVGYDRELMVEIIDLFLQERQRQVLEMRDALAASEYDQLSRVAHTIKGSLGSLYATRARMRAQQLELGAKNKEGELCRQAFAALEHDLEALEPHLVSLRSASSSL